MSVSYVGSGPYCYANSLAMVMGEGAPEVGVIEVLTGSPYGMHLIGGRVPMFDPFGWDPEMGVDAAVSLLGWGCERSDGGSDAEAVDRLKAARGPVLAGPVEMGLLGHQPGANGAVGVDHYVVVLGVEGDLVLMHDPEGYPYATLPVAAFVEAWRGETVGYLERPFAMRQGFVRQRQVRPADALRESLVQGAAWLRGRHAEAAATRLAEMVEGGLDDDIRGLLQAFGIRVGARRLNDLAACLGMLGMEEASDIAATQARIVGGLQLPAVTGDDKALAAGLYELAPTYERLREAIG
ncbi:hypothetical protein [Nonomuraea sediminis]|uniref:hypothetical protein n=1 Tax=Nonomuraea sediminis TaxID=2835864 RepID=UPI001BDD5163|nr:hypothetical protein [Nonomuraea sediminis]